MIIYFSRDRRTVRSRPEPNQVKMSLLLMTLKNHLGFDNFDDEFYNFVRETYKIDTKFRDGNIIDSIEMPDEVYTMLLLIHNRQ